MTCSQRLGAIFLTVGCSLTAVAQTPLPATGGSQLEAQDKALDVFKEVRQKYLVECSKGNDEACTDLIAGYRRAAAAPDSTEQLKHDMFKYLMHALSIRGGALREKGKLEEALQVLTAGWIEVREHFDGGRHSHTFIDNQRLFQELAMTLLQLGRAQNADTVIHTARNAVDKLWAARKNLTSKAGQELLKAGMVSGEEFEAELSTLYASNYFERPRARRYPLKMTKVDLQPRALESLRRAEQWLLRKDEAGIAALMDLNANIRYAVLKNDIGWILEAQGKKKEAEQEFLSAYSAACSLRDKGQGKKGIEAMNADLASGPCEMAIGGWSVTSGEAEKAFDEAFDNWYREQVKLLEEGASPASPYVRKP